MVRPLARHGTCSFADPWTAFDAGLGKHWVFLTPEQKILFHKVRSNGTTLARFLTKRGSSIIPTTFSICSAIPSSKSPFCYSTSGSSSLAGFVCFVGLGSFSYHACVLPTHWWPYSRASQCGASSTPVFLQFASTIPSSPGPPPF